MEETPSTLLTYPQDKKEETTNYTTEKQYAQCQRRISYHLRGLNEILSELDQEMIKYRALIRFKNHCPYDRQPEDLTNNRLWWYREIQNELKVFHYYANFSLKALCAEHGISEQLYVDSV